MRNAYLNMCRIWSLPRLRGLVVVLLVSVVAGCATYRPMMATPSVYVDQNWPPFADVPTSLRTPDVDVMYATDRKPEEDESSHVPYGFRRSASLAFGSVKVNLGSDLTWDDLVKASETSKRDHLMEMSLGSMEEIGRFPETPAPHQVVDASTIIDREYEAKVDEVGEQFREEIRRRLAATPRKEVFIYVHGYGNTFEDAVFVIGEYWHFLGREGVPISYTWPAGYPGLFGYTYDRESSEFTVLHFKQMLSLVSEMPEVKALHIVAHSRGADVVTAAVRELFIYARGAGIHPLERYKIRNLVLAAPDLDLQVTRQRLVGELVAYGVGHWTIYYSPADKALDLAEMLFASPAGRVGEEDMTTRFSAIDRKGITSRANIVSMIRFGGGESDKYGHSYYRTNPGVSSDIILLLRHGFAPGTSERPLVPLAPGYWDIPPGYPNDISN